MDLIRIIVLVSALTVGLAAPLLKNEGGFDSDRRDTISKRVLPVWDPLNEPNSGLKCAGAKGLQAAIDEIDRMTESLNETIDTTKFDDTFLDLSLPHLRKSKVKVPDLDDISGRSFVVTLTHERRVDGFFTESDPIQYTFDLEANGRAKRMAFWQTGKSGLEMKLLYVWIDEYDELNAAMAATNEFTTPDPRDANDADTFTCADLDDAMGLLSLERVKEMVFYSHMDFNNMSQSEEVLLFEIKTGYVSER